MSKQVDSVDLVALLKQLREDEAQHERQLSAVREEIRTVEQALAIAEKRFAVSVNAPFWREEPREAGSTGVAAEPDPLLVAAPTAPPPAGSAGRPISATFSGAVAPTSTQRINELARKVRGLTQAEALKRIAQHNDGIVRTIEAKPILIKAGLTKGQPKHVGTHIFHLLDASPEFEKIAPGTFRWLPHFIRAEGQRPGDQSSPVEIRPAAGQVDERQVFAEEGAADSADESRRGEQRALPLENGTYRRVAWLSPRPGTADMTKQGER